MAGIPLSSGFNVSAGIPLDLRTTVADITERDNIPTIGRYPGLLVFVESESKYYYLKTGITNSDWAELSGFVSHTHVKADITDFTHTHLKSDITDFAHTHPISEITPLQTELDNKIPLNGAAITGAIGETYNYMTRIMNPRGGMLSERSSSVTGMLKIVLPVWYSSTMISFDLTIFNYISAGGVAKMRIGGYTSSSSTWYNVGAYELASSSNKFYTVRFGDENGKCVIFVGDTGTTWNYPKVMISDVMLGHSNYDYNNFNDGWELSFVTSTGSASIKQTITPKLVANEADVANTWKTPRNLTIGNTAKSVNGANDVSWSLSEIGAEPAITKSTGYLKWNGSAWTFLNESYALSTHIHTNYTPFASNYQSVPANTGKWIRIATSVNGVSKNDGLFEVDYGVSGHHGRVSFRASSHYNNYNSIRIVKINGSHYNNSYIGIQTARVVFKSGVYSNEYAYVELYVKNYNTASTMSVYTRMIDALGWSLTTGDGSIPTGYTSKNLSLKLGYPIYSTDDTRTVVSASSGALSINAQYDRNNIVANITQNTTINIYYIPDGYMGSILLYLNGTYTLSIGNVTDESGAAYSKYLLGNLSNLSSGYYLLTYRAIPDASGNLKCFISISDKFTSI